MAIAIVQYIIIHVMSYSCERTRTKAYNDDVRWRLNNCAGSVNFHVSPYPMGTIFFCTLSTSS